MVHCRPCFQALCSTLLTTQVLLSAGLADLRLGEEWSDPIGGPEDEIAHCIQPTLDGGCVIAGYAHDGPSGRVRAYVVKLNRKLEIAWQERYGNGPVTIAYSVIETLAGFIVAGTTRTEGRYVPYLIGVSKRDGAIRSEFTDAPPRSAWDDVPVLVRQNTRSSSPLVLVGSTMSRARVGLGAGWSDIYIAEVNPFARLLRGRTWVVGSFGATSSGGMGLQTPPVGLGGVTHAREQDEYGTFVAEAASNEYLIAGSSNSFSTRSDAYFVKVGRKDQRFIRRSQALYGGGDSDDHGLFCQRPGGGEYVLAGLAGDRVFFIKGSGDELPGGRVRGATLVGSFVKDTAPELSIHGKTLVPGRRFWFPCIQYSRSDGTYAVAGHRDIYQPGSGRAAHIVLLDDGFKLVGEMTFGEGRWGTCASVGRDRAGRYLVAGCTARRRVDGRGDRRPNFDILVARLKPIRRSGAMRGAPGGTLGFAVAPGAGGSLPAPAADGGAGGGGGAAEDAPRWTVYITNDNCPDYTWGLTEERTRQSFADIVRGHLDEMIRTDEEVPENRDRYNMAVAQEALCFVERYPDRKGELIRRLKEGRLYMSPFLCNSLWAFQDMEGVIRTLYPARRLEKEWGLAGIDVAEHIEEPSLPWGIATILAGCGIRWLSVPYYAYDSTFGGLRNPPLFILEGPDGSHVRVVMDPWACGKASYTQGAALLRDTGAIEKEWTPHYRGMGDAYPVRAILASGTHGDISPGSGGQARGFAERIIEYNRVPGREATMVNAILPQFCDAVDRVEDGKPFLRILRGSFGHSWDLWTVSLAAYAAGMREGARRFLAAEALLVMASAADPGLHDGTRVGRERAEWCWAMLSDHAWNGTNDANKRHNAGLRRGWSEELNRTGSDLIERGWGALGLAGNNEGLALFNSLSVPRAALVRMAPQGGASGEVHPEGVNWQIVNEGGRRVLYFVSEEVPGFAFGVVPLVSGPAHGGNGDRLLWTDTELESPFYSLKADVRRGGVASLIHRATKTELVQPKGGRSLCQTVYFDGEEHTLKDVTSECVAAGPVMARLRVSGTVEGIRVVQHVTVYTELDRVDFDLSIHKPPRTVRERLCQVFPVLPPGAVLRVETTGAVIRPRPRPDGDLLPGADARRFVVQGFVDASHPGGPGVTIAPLDAYALRLDLDPITFEALGNDQNHREVTRDQDGVTEFRFRYSLRAHAGGYDQADAVAWSRAVATPIVVGPGTLPDRLGRPRIGIDPRRAVATCLKPADGDAAGGSVLRIWEVAGRSGPAGIDVAGYRRAVRTDLLERDQEELEIVKGRVELPLRPFGFGALRLLR